jgi:hypothetical protein
MTAVVTDGKAVGAGDVESAGTGVGAGTPVWVLVAVQATALTIQVVAVDTAWHGASASGNVVSCAGLALTFASALWALTRARLSRPLRNAAVMGLGLTTAVQWRMNDPLLFRGYDEQLHMRTLSDIEASHSLFQPHPILAVSARYPALETLTALFHQLGIPLMLAATLVVLLARLALVLALCAAVEHLTGSARAGGLAVAVYAVSPQFVFFNSQFAYQTLSLPLALTAVAFVARARWAQNPTPFFCGATVCLLAVAVTHHLTSWITAGFLVAWAITEPRGRARRRILFGAAVAVLAGAVWAAIQWSLLRDYFGPMIDDATSQLNGNGNRELFTDTTPDQKPMWQRGLMVYYAVAVTSAVSWLVLIRGRSILLRARGACTNSVWRPRMLLVAIVALIPLLFAARVLPSFGEIGDRANSFLFLPFSLLVAAGVVRMRRQWPVFVRPLVVVLATAVFLGGYLLGSGSDWARLPGGYLPGADGRSMDAETLASMQWAHDELPPGSRIAADRMNSTLLASEAGLWPIMATVGPSLYREPSWHQEQTDVARTLRLRYLYVDRRFSDEVPYVAGYFDEKAPPLRFTAAALAKFDHVPGIREVYRHGPISIYDLQGLGISELRSGWVGRTPSTNVPVQILLGLLLGCALGYLGRSEPSRRLAGLIRSIRAAAGPFLTYAFGLAALCIASIVLLLAHVWLSPVFLLSLALTALIANLDGAEYVLRRAAARFRWTWFATGGAVALVVAAAITVATLDASAAHHLSSACQDGTCHEN